MTDDKIYEIARRAWDTGSRELERLKSTVSGEALAECVKRIGDTRGRVFTAGVGTSGAAAKKIAHSLSCIERPAFFLSPGDAVHGALGSVQSGDTGILISKGGGTGEILRLLPSLKTKGVFIIGVTENETSALADECDLLLRIRIEKEADEFNMLATTSTMAVIAVFDAICIALMEYTGYTREQFAVIHPSGAVGERLLRGEK